MLILTGTQARIVILKPRSTDLGVFLVNGEFQVGDVLREESADCNPTHASPNAYDFDWAVVVDTSPIWFGRYSGSHGRCLKLSNWFNDQISGMKSVAL